jgi:hypothetical protein
LFISTLRIIDDFPFQGESGTLPFERHNRNSSRELLQDADAENTLTRPAG